MSEPANGKQNWFLILSALGVAFTLLAAADKIIELKIENGVAKATASKNEELAALRAQLEAKESAFQAKLTEVETQFRAEDQMRNVQWADMRRTLALLWKKSYGEDYPTGIQFYPSIAQPTK